MKLFKKKINFFDLLGKQCDTMVRGMQELYNYCTTCDEKYGDEVIKIEDEGDMVRRILIDELNKTFITPMERNDLFDLSRQIDEILDYAKTTVDETRLFKVKPNEDMVKMISILLDITVHIQKAVTHMEKHKSISRDEAIKVKSLENKVGAAYYKALARLFNTDDIHEIFKYREIYRHLNTTADVADMAMDSLLDALMTL